jgi:hypothetical protein
MIQNTDCVQHRRNLRLAIDNGQFPHLKVLSQSVVMYILKCKEDSFLRCVMYQSHNAGYVHI